MVNLGHEGEPVTLVFDGDGTLWDFTTAMREALELTRRAMADRFDISPARAGGRSPRARLPPHLSTNGNGDVARMGLADHFDTVFYAESIATRKPDRAYRRRAAVPERRWSAWATRWRTTSTDLRRLARGVE